MWEPRRLTALWASTVCFTFLSITWHCSIEIKSHNYWFLPIYTIMWIWHIWSQAYLLPDRLQWNKLQWNKFWINLSPLTEETPAKEELPFHFTSILSTSKWNSASVSEFLQLSVKVTFKIPSELYDTALFVYTLILSTFCSSHRT
jgi:hypothetical protein